MGSDSHEDDEEKTSGVEGPSSEVYSICTGGDVSSINQVVSSIKYHVSRIKYQSSSIKYQVSSISSIMYQIFKYQ